MNGGEQTRHIHPKGCPMETLQDIMTTPDLTITPDASVSHALGIFTDRALIQIRAGRMIDYAWSMHKVMSSPPLTASVDIDYRRHINSFFSIASAIW